MALIKCPECNKEISDKAEICIHCGYPLAKYLSPNDNKKESLVQANDSICPICKSTKKRVLGDKVHCAICGYVFSGLELNENSSFESTTNERKPIPPLTISQCPICASPADKIKLDESKGSYVCSVCDYRITYDKDKYQEYKNKMFQNESARLSFDLLREQSKNIVRCPKCNSTSITTGARGISDFWGLLGASATVNRCAKCGYKWYPH